MKQRPILFSTPMVQAILEGRKTQTRRIVKPQPIVGLENIKDDIFFDTHTSGIEQKVFKCPYGKIGDVLWVRETFLENDGEYYFKASMDDSDNKYLSGSWKPSIHMPKIAARIYLKITNVRVEKLQDISEQDSVNEGVEESSIDKGWYKNYVNNLLTKNAIRSFFSLWESINGNKSLDNNPWVWLIEFERIEKPV